MIFTLAISILVEGVVVLAYSLWRRNPFLPVLLTSTGGNLITQPFLWIVLTIFFRSYVITLFVAEFLIWMIESLLLYAVPANRLRFSEATLLSLSMNLTSFILGWFLPV